MGRFVIRGTVKTSRTSRLAAIRNAIGQAAVRGTPRLAPCPNCRPRCTGRRPGGCTDPGRASSPRGRAAAFQHRSDDKTIALVRTGKNMEGKTETDTVTLTWVSPKEITFAAIGKSGATTNWTFNANLKK